MTMDSAPALPTYTEDDLATLTPPALVEILIRDEDRAPRIVIDRCAAYGEDMVEFLRVRVDDERAWRFGVSGGEWWLGLHAAMILGLIASESAGLLLVQLMRRMSLAEDDSLQSWLAAYWPALFANKPAETVEAGRALCEDQTFNWYIRCQAAEVVVAAATRAGDETLERELDWLAARVSDDADDWSFRISGANTLLDFPRERHHRLLVDMAEREADRANKSGWLGVDISADDVDTAFAQKLDTPSWRRHEEPWHFYARGRIARRQDRWAEEAARAAKDTPDFDGDRFFEAPAIPYTRPTEKIGRNDPCPCGSGKKYKRCCMTK
jgi:hypothetical protein